MKKILLTGFEPFGGEATNPSWEAVARLDGQVILGTHRIVAVRLPCTFATSLEVLHAALHTHQPELALAVGQAGGRVDLTLEKVAINFQDARIPDNAGAQPVNQAVLADAPTAYFASLPVKAIAQALRNQGLPASVSYTAGTYVCNHVFFALMHHASQSKHLKHAGFMHIPFLPEQASAHPGSASMALEQVVAGIRCVLETSLTCTQEVLSSEGCTH